MQDAHYRLYYWPFIQGRGEFVRLAFEASGTEYVDVARLPEAEGGGVPAMLEFVKGAQPGAIPFAPPFLVHGDLVIAQTANVLQYVAPRIGMVPESDAARLHANQLQLTLADLASEVHDTHHPIATGLYYEDQKPEALKRARSFVNERAPKFLRHFAQVLERSGGEFLLGELSYVDLSLFQLLRGFEYAFPRAAAAHLARFPELAALAARVEQLPRLSAYLGSSRRLPFNPHGLFRSYPELDLAPE